MKTVAVEGSAMDRAVGDAQQGRVMLTREGKPVALLIALDEEQRELGTSAEFWKLIGERRRQPTESRVVLEEPIASRNAGRRD